MSNPEILEKKYELIKNNIIGYGNFGNVYKVKNIKNGYYYAIKEVDKLKFKSDINKLKNGINTISQIGTDNSINIIETFDTKRFFYIVMELCECNLDDYLKKRENKITINEIREVLIQLNNTFKRSREKKIIRKDLKPKNILISLNKLDKCLIKLSDYGISKFIDFNDSKEETFYGSIYTMSPEVIENGDEKLTEKSEIWSLGVTIYYLLFREYPYNGNNEYQLLEDIKKSNKILKKTDNEELNNLLNRMLTIDVSDRISWNDYFNHSFFKTNNSLLSFPQFNFECNKHNSPICYYCKTCKLNICEDCLKSEPNSHEIISVSKIGLTDNEIKQFNNYKKEINDNLDKFKKMIDKTDALINQMKTIKTNNSIYQNDNLNNYKKYYLDCFEVLNEQLKNKINLIDINVQDNSENRNSNSNTYRNSNNFIICEYNIDNEHLFKSTKIINCYENVILSDSNNEGTNNKNDIQKNCELYLNGKKINFSFKIEFTQGGKNIIKMIFKKPLTNLNYMFYDCKSLTSIDLSNFNFDNVTDMSNMFRYCRSLTSINFSNINTEKVTNMSYMFHYCASIKNLDISNFNTNKVVNMKFMFGNCSCLNELKLSNFNTKNVNNMRGMFNLCIKLKNLDLSNFDTQNVTDMFNMFCGCSSLENLNISSFSTDNVVNMSGMLYQIKGNCNIIAKDKKIIDLIKK